MFRARLMATATRCWCGEQVPVSRRGRILPRSETNWLTKRTSLKSMTSIFSSQNLHTLRRRKYCFRGPPPGPPGPLLPGRSDERGLSPMGIFIHSFGSFRQFPVSPSQESEERPVACTITDDDFCLLAPDFCLSAYPATGAACGACGSDPAGAGAGFFGVRAACLARQA